MSRETTPAASETSTPIYQPGDKAYINGKEVIINIPVPDKPGYYYLKSNWIDPKGNESLGPEYHISVLKPNPKRPS